MVKKPRLIVELLILMADQRKIFKEECLGLCALSTCMLAYGVIQWNERYLLLDYIRHNRPKGAVFYNYFWDPGEWVPRRRWLKYHIKKLSEQ